jgi:hypothetical protein
VLPRDLWPPTPTDPSVDQVVPLQLPRTIYRGNCQQCLSDMAQQQLSGTNNATPTTPSPPTPATSSPPTTSCPPTTAATVKPQSVKPKYGSSKRPRKSVPLMISHRPPSHPPPNVTAPPNQTIPPCPPNTNFLGFQPMPPISNLDPTIPQFIPQSTAAPIYTVPPPTQPPVPPPAASIAPPLLPDAPLVFNNVQPVPPHDQLVQECALSNVKSAIIRPDQPPATFPQFPQLLPAPTSYAIDFNFRGHHFRINARADAVWGSVATDAAAHVGLPLHCLEFVKYVRPLKVALYLRPVHELGLFNHDESIARTIDVRIRKEIPPYINP